MDAVREVCEEMRRELAIGDEDFTGPGPATLRSWLSRLEGDGQPDPLAKLRNLKPGWDSYGAAVLTPVALEVAGIMLRPPQVVPTAKGGVQLEWHEGGYDIEVEVRPDGSLCTALSEGGGLTGEQRRSGQVGNPSVRGRCPSCGDASLFLGSGGCVTCSRLECPKPTAAHDLLERAGAAEEGAGESCFAAGGLPDRSGMWTEPSPAPPPEPEGGQREWRGDPVDGAARELIALLRGVALGSAPDFWRRLYAGLALHGRATNRSGGSHEDTAQRSLADADALLAALDREPGAPDAPPARGNAPQSDDPEAGGGVGATEGGSGLTGAPGAPGGRCETRNDHGERCAKDKGHGGLHWTVSRTWR